MIFLTTAILESEKKKSVHCLLPCKGNTVCDLLFQTGLRCQHGYIPESDEICRQNYRHLWSNNNAMHTHLIYQREVPLCPGCQQRKGKGPSISAQVSKFGEHVTQNGYSTRIGSWNPGIPIRYHAETGSKPLSVSLFVSFSLSALLFSKSAPVLKVDL